MCRIGVELCQEISEDQWFESLSTYQNVFLSNVFEPHSVVELLLQGKCIIQDLQLWDQVDQCGQNEDCYKCPSGPMVRTDVPISNGAHGNHQVIVRLEKTDPLVNAEEMVYDAYPG